MLNQSPRASVFFPGKVNIQYILNNTTLRPVHIFCTSLWTWKHKTRGGELLHIPGPLQVLSSSSFLFHRHHPLHVSSVQASLPSQLLDVRVLHPSQMQNLVKFLHRTPRTNHSHQEKRLSSKYTWHRINFSQTYALPTNKPAYSFLWVRSSESACSESCSSCYRITPWSTHLQPWFHSPWSLCPLSTAQNRS